MRPNILFNRLRKGEVCLGLGLMYPAPGIIECMCGGWDFVWIDGQHGQISYDTALGCLHAAGAAGVETVVRVPGHEPGMLGKWADLAPCAVMVPMIDTVDQAGAVVEGLRFPPLGERSYGGRRVIDLDGRDFFRERELMVVAQVETLESVQNASAIINTEGVDALFFGPDDMKVRMGIPINTAITDHPQLREAMKATADAARKAGKIAGSVAATGPALQMAIELGYQLIVGGGDVAFIRTSAAARLDELKKARAGANITPANKSAGVY
jgi:4-hydroxy-2-oxoheptanedioate aldolase